MTHPSDEDWAARVIQERDQLAVKIGKLAKFFESTTFQNLTPFEQTLMRQQAGFMYLYLATLEQRIAAFPK